MVISVEKPQKIIAPVLTLNYECSQTGEQIKEYIRLPFTEYSVLQRIKSKKETCSSIFSNFSKILTAEFELNKAVFKAGIQFQFHCK